MTAIRSVAVQMQRPSETDPVGRITEGFYTVTDDTLTMTYTDGRPVEGFTVTLKPGDDPEAIARVLTRKVRRQVLGLSEDGEAFSRALQYPKMGLA